MRDRVIISAAQFEAHIGCVLFDLSTRLYICHHVEKARRRCDVCPNTLPDQTADEHVTRQSHVDAWIPAKYLCASSRLILILLVYLISIFYEERVAAAAGTDPIVVRLLIQRNCTQAASTSRNCAQACVTSAYRESIWYYSDGVSYCFSIARWKHHVAWIIVQRSNWD